MKKLTIILGMLILSVVVLGQRNFPEKNDNTIIIKTEKTDTENFKEFGRYLIGNGYSFEENDRDFLMLVTYYTKLKNVGVMYKKIDYKLFVNFVNGNIVIKSRYVIDLNNADDVREWVYIQKKSSFNYKIYMSFLPVLREYSEELFFLKK